mgnify:CR=1 FL=1
MAELNDTYVVHTAMIRCSMGMRETYLVLDDTHGVFLRQQPQMTVDDSVGEVNVRCFGGCYSMENPSTKAEADRIQKAVEEECPDTFLDSVLKPFYGRGKRNHDAGSAGGSAENRRGLYAKYSGRNQVGQRKRRG